MSATHTNDTPQAVSGSTSPLPESTSQSRDNDPTVTTEAEKQAQAQAEEEEEHTSRESQSQSQSEETQNCAQSEKEEGEEEEKRTSEPDAPPLPDEIPPPLPNEAPPGDDDGWEPVWDANAQAYYFYNRYTDVSQWENPRVPQHAAEPPAPGTAPASAPDKEEPSEKVAPPLGGYNPAIHGDYDPTAPYAQQYERQEEAQVAPGMGMGMGEPAGYGAVGSFNRFTGRWQAESQNPEYHNDENKSRRQMNAYFDVDAAANAHDGRSLRAERSAKKLSKKELKAFKDKRREKKEEKRRAWLRD
ncbi:WW domain-containing protein [Aspergillus undulatus]|uniref:WW domain-containing protein n=1 Tax=Aspergillus undulatus TaxID=1810928 RepID=UPI003CCD3E9F